MRIDLVEIYLILNKGVNKIDPVDNWSIKPCMAIFYKDYLEVGYTWKIGKADYHLVRCINLWVVEKCVISPGWFVEQQINHLINSVIWDLVNNHYLYKAKQREGSL